jgi:dTDP-4-amino-4,6-dideoxygalactose transaminase
MKNRNIIRDEMLNKGIQTGYHYQPNHWLEFYKEDDSLQLPTTELVFPELLSLPLHPDLSVSDVEFVAETLINCIS